MLMLVNRSLRSLPQLHKFSHGLARSSWRWTTIAVLLVGVTIVPPAIAQDVPPRILSVTGQGTETVQTTLAQVRLGVEVEGKTAQQVQAEVARRSEAVVALLRSRQVEKLQTTGINLSPQYRFTNGKRDLIGYQGRNIVSFRVPAAQAGPILDDAVKAGATRIDGISFMASEAAIAQAQQVALRSATQDARTQANIVLSSLNLTTKDIVGIQINGARTPIPRPVPSNLARTQADATSTTPVIGGEQQVRAAVTLQISY